MEWNKEARSKDPMINPNKKTTLEDLNPDPEKFRFENYAYIGIGDLAEALSCMFLAGTPKDRVDHILIDIAGATYKYETIEAETDLKKKTIHKYLYAYE